MYYAILLCWNISFWVVNLVCFLDKRLFFTLSCYCRFICYIISCTLSFVLSMSLQILMFQLVLPAPFSRKRCTPFLVITKLWYLHCCYGHFLSHSSTVFFPRLLLIAVCHSACRQWRWDQSNHQQWSFSAGLTIDGWELPIPMMIEHVIFCSRLICSSCWLMMLSPYFNHGDAWCWEWEWACRYLFCFSTYFVSDPVLCINPVQTGTFRYPFCYTAREFISHKN